MSTIMSNIHQQEILPLKDDVGALGNRINTECKSLHDTVNKEMTIRFAVAFRDARIYRQGLQVFYHIYKAIEASLDREFAKGDSDEIAVMLQNIWKPDLARRARAEEDLLFYYDDRKDKFMNPIMPTQISITKHIQEVTQKKPHLLLAYLHVMYLALFAGGRIMKSNLSRATGMFPQKEGYSHAEIVRMGSNIFNFNTEDSDMLRFIFKRDYELFTRNSLTESQKVEIIQESKHCFQQFGECIKEIEKHNLARIKLKWSYFALTKGPYFVATFLALTVLYYVRRLLTAF